MGGREDKANWPVIGHEWAVGALAHSLETDRVAHAYLITGPHAIGKTTLARAWAQALECTGTPRPCGVCASCRQIARDRHPDVQVVEGVPVGYKFDEKQPPPPPRANDREPRILKVDQIRAIQYGLSRSPFQGRWKIVIVRRFEEAQEEAANAFLKTLEEPPPYVCLILTARDSSLLLPTIVSRCQALALRPLPPVQVETALQERWHVSDPSFAHLLARLSTGRLGWAVRASQDHSTLLDNRRAHLDALDTVLHQGRAERLTYAEDLVKEKEALPELLEYWLGWWRDLLWIQNGDSSRITNIDREETLRDQAARLSRIQVQEALKAIRSTLRHLEQNANTRLAIGVLLLKLPALVQ
jgi:DNA polymerase-3 subunit delta'